jgi:hypothetical protein
MGVYADIGNRLIERGFAAIPIMPGTKRPGFLHAGQWVGLSNWQRRFNCGVPAEAVRLRWGKGEAGVGVITGPASGGAVAIDIDTDDAAVMAALLRVLPPTPVKKRGAKGETWFFYGPGIGESKTWKIDGATIVELIGPGRQTVVPPTRHPDTGQPYVYTGSETLEDVAPAELPPLGADVVEAITAALKPFGYEIGPTVGGGRGSAFDLSPHRELNDMALANLAAWVPDLGLYRCRPARGGYEAVPLWRSSTTGRAPEQRHRNLKIAPNGIRDFGADQGYTPLDLIMTALTCDLEGAWRFLSERLGFAECPAIELEAAEVAAPKIAAPEISEPAPGGGQDDPLNTYTYCPGVVGDIIDWIVATARRPNRVLALGAAVTVVGTLIGRRVAGPTRSATHLYVVAVGPTGSGKQHLLDSTTTLMQAAGAQGHIGPSEFISMPAVLNFITRKPLALCLQDEYGAFLRRVTHKKATVFETALSKILRTLWGTSFSAMATPEWANREMKRIQSPALSILGVSTPDEFHAALQGESVGNGFLNRYLVLNSDLRACDRDPQMTPGQVPESLKAALRRLYLWSGPQSLLQIDNPEVAFVPDVLPWQSQQAKTCYRDFERMRDDYLDSHSGTKPYLARCGEIAIRLATIRAAGRGGPNASIGLSDVEWGAGMSWTAGLALANAAMDWLPETERGMWGEKILALIERRGPMKVRDIQQYIRSAIRSADIKDILAQFVNGGLIEWTVDGYRVVKKDRNV